MLFGIRILMQVYPLKTRLRSLALQGYCTCDPGDLSFPNDHPVEKEDEENEKLNSPK